MDQELGRKMSALRLAEANRSDVARPTIGGLQYQAVSSPSPSYSYSNAVPEVKCAPQYGTKSEGIYANLMELAGARGKDRYQDSFVPPPEQFSQRLVQVTHVPTQSRVSLEEAMRYTPPNVTPYNEEAPVYENIQFYSSQKKPLPEIPSVDVIHKPSYQPVSFNLTSMKTNAQYATRQAFEQTQYPSSSLKCQSLSPSYTAPQLIRPTPQRYSQPSSTHFPMQQSLNTSGHDVSPQRTIKQVKSADLSPVQPSSVGSSPKMPLSTVQLKKVF